MTFQRRDILRLAAASAAGASFHAQAQKYPSRPVTMVVPYPAGGSTDIVARLVALRLGDTLGQSVIVENRGGAAGNIGASYVAKGPADGYRILLATQPVVAINPFLYPDSAVDAQKDLVPVTDAVNAVVAIAVHPSLGANNVRELIDVAKRTPGGLNYGTSGAGSGQHIAGAMLASKAGIMLTHVPYRGGGPMSNDLVAGHIKVGIGILSVLKPLAEQGKVKIVAIGERTRFAAMPQLPTISETIPGFEMTTWFGFFAAAGVPKEVVQTLAREIGAAMNTAEVKAKLADAMMVVRANGPESLARQLKGDQEMFGRLIREHRISVV